jgi:hypothetical protein
MPYAARRVESALKKHLLPAPNTLYYCWRVLLHVIIAVTMVIKAIRADRIISAFTGTLVIRRSIIQGY